MSSADVIPFRGNKPKPVLSWEAPHPLPWTYGNGFIWDANRRVVGSTIEKASAEWIVRCVNAQHNLPTEEAEPA